MGMMAEIAVIMAAHNEERYVERALRSILNQSAPRDSYDVFVVDDGSSDATKRIVEGFGDEVIVLHHERQLGLPAALNTGLRAAHARYVVRMDADDYVHQDFVRVLTLFLDLNPSMDAVACDYYTVDGSEEHIAHIDCMEHPIGCGIMFRKDRLIALGLYDESFLMAEDVDLRLRFEKRWRIHHVQLPLYRYRLHDENMTLDHESHEQHIERAYRKHAEGGS